jgi:hypothetical protein
VDATVKSIFFPNVPPRKLRRLDFARANTSSCGVAKSKKRNSNNAARTALPEDPPRAYVYDALATLNRDFERVLEDLQRLEALYIFPRRWQRQFLKVWRATLGEVRAWVSFDVVETLHQTEEREWTSFGRRRRRLEKLSASSDDTLMPIESSGRKSPRRK